MRTVGVWLVIVFAVSGCSDGWGGYPADCSGQPDGYYCNDGNACTQTDVCLGGVCVGSNRVACKASDPCHLAGVCDPSTGLCSNPLRRKEVSPVCIRTGYD